ncbi:MAG: protein kinase [Myxococcales bacterium]|nr:protein kinase [Myxococcales bacterium]
MRPSPTVVGREEQLSPLSGYALVAQVSRGVGTTVYRGATGEGARVAVKLFDEALLSEQMPGVARARRLSAPTAVEVLDVGKVDGRLAVVSEWVDGASLAELLAELGKTGVRLPLSVALRIVAEVARALVAAHELEGGALAHGALEPRHVLCAWDGSVKVCGFGGPARRGRGLRAERAYVAPEVRRGESVDVLSDVYSVGALAYHLVTGLTPVQAAVRMPLSSTAVAPLPSRLNPGLDSSLDEPILDALDRDPGLRPHSMRALCGQLDRCFEELGLEQTPSELAQLVRELFPDRVPKSPPKAVVLPRPAVREPPAPIVEDEEEEWTAAAQPRRSGRRLLVPGAVALAAVAAAFFGLRGTGQPSAEAASEKQAAVERDIELPSAEQGKVSVTLRPETAVAPKANELARPTSATSTRAAVVKKAVPSKPAKKAKPKATRGKRGR